MRIPKSFKLFGTTISVSFDNLRLNAKGSYGDYIYSTNKISLSNTDGNSKLSNDKIMDTFYHEKVHSILWAMNERELNENEKFVDVFAKLLRQSDETTIYK